MSKHIKWEEVGCFDEPGAGLPDFNHGGAREHTYGYISRIKISGGYLYNVTTNYGVGLTFVPDNPKFEEPEVCKLETPK
jgi:hypothetical protein